MRGSLLRGSLTIALGLCLWAPRHARPQINQEMAGRPGEKRPVLPDFEPPKVPPGTILPTVLPAAKAEGLQDLFSAIRIPVRDIRITGNTVLGQGELEEIVSPYRNQRLSFADLERIRDELTRAHIRHGYLTSGAVIPDQVIRDGVVEISVVEGRLAAIDTQTEGRLRTGYIDGRLRPALSGVVNVNHIEEALQILRQNPRIGTVEAELVPGEVRGESVLQLHVSEGRSRAVVLRLDNYQPLSVGSGRGAASFVHRNISGRGDTISTGVRLTHGLRTLDAAYDIPLNSRDTTISLFTEVSRSSVIEEPFANLDIKSRMESYGFMVLHPVRRTIGSEFDVFATGELRRSQSFLLGSGFQFSDDLTEDGTARVSVLRFGQTWTRSGTKHALALRNTLSIGLNIFGATPHGGPEPGKRFFSWLGQAQWARRLRSLRSTQLILRGDAQLANSALPGLEKFVTGGRATVRGYRENEFVRDNGLIGSLELRIPLTREDRSSTLEFAPFADVGRSWNRRGGLAVNEPVVLPSAGAGLLWRSKRHIQAEIYWGYAFRELPGPSHWSLQDSGVHLGLSWSLQ